MPRFFAWLSEVGQENGTRVTKESAHGAKNASRNSGTQGPARGRQLQNQSPRAERAARARAWNREHAASGRIRAAVERAAGRRKATARHPAPKGQVNFAPGLRNVP